MHKSEIQEIELKLEVKLPTSYKQLLSENRWAKFVSSVEPSIWTQSAKIIERTLEYRRGFQGAEPWPTRFVCIGDEQDACPYALNSETGRVVRTDHGNISKTLDEYDDLSVLVQQVDETMEALPRNRKPGPKNVVAKVFTHLIVAVSLIWIGHDFAPWALVFLVFVGVVGVHLVWKEIL